MPATDLFTSEEIGFLFFTFFHRHENAGCAPLSEIILTFFRRLFENEEMREKLFNYENKFKRV